MADALHLRLALPERRLVDEKIKSLTVFSTEGEFVILPDHCQIIAALQMGRLIIEHLDGSKLLFAADAGFLEGGVDHINVILKRCVAISGLDEAQIRRELELVGERLTATSGMSSAQTAALQSEKRWLQLQVDLFKAPQ